MFTPSGVRTGAGYADDPNLVVHWRFANPPAGCGMGYDVSLLGGKDFTTIQGAVNAVSGTSLWTNTCIVVRDTQT